MDEDCSDTQLSDDGQFNEDDILNNEFCENPEESSGEGINIEEE
jgi:hypothetical protein